LSYNPVKKSAERVSPYPPRLGHAETTLRPSAKSAPGPVNRIAANPGWVRCLYKIHLARRSPRSVN